MPAQRLYLLREASLSGNTIVDGALDAHSDIAPKVAKDHTVQPASQPLQVVLQPLNSALQRRGHSRLPAAAPRVHLTIFVHHNICSSCV